jgi:hypothetical protein
MRNILMILAICAFAGCNSGNGSETETIQAVETGMSHQQQADTTGESALNGKMKWKVDMATAENVKALQGTADAFSKKNHTVPADFHTVADELQSGLNKLIKECRMKGADHDALHHWLEPLLIGVKTLKAVTHTGEANKSFEKIHQQLTVYNHYFER